MADAAEAGDGGGHGVGSNSQADEMEGKDRARAASAARRTQRNVEKRDGAGGSWALRGVPRRLYREPKVA
jgi:hypothetical protein